MAKNTTGERAVRDRARSAPVTQNVVHRSRLYRRLDAAALTPLFLVCAPAGYGKSLLVASWVSQRAVEHVAWASLTESDTSPRRVWTSICRALGRAFPTLADELDQIIEIAGRAPADVPERLHRCLDSLDGNCFLVVDDLHVVVDPEVHDQLVELATSGSNHLRIIVMTRHDPPWPLHRLRLQGILDDIQSDSLAFNDEEASALFAELGLPMSAQHVSRLVSRTEGWAAALRLTAIGAAQAAEPAEFVSAVSGRDAYVADYLMREVYDALDEDWRSFLSRVCIVDELCPALADALTDEAGAGSRLEGLARDNAFFTALGHRPGWYRAHPLLLDFLRSRVLTETAVERELHRKAAAWFCENKDPQSALRHAVKAHEWALAGDLVGTHLVTWVVRHPPSELLSILDQVPRDVVFTQPGLALGVAGGRAMVGDLSDVADLVASAQKQLDSVKGRRRRRYEFLIALITSGTRRWTGDLDAVLAGYRCISSDTTVLSSLGLTDWDAIRTLLLSNIGVCELWTGDEIAAAEHLTEAAREDGNRALVLPTLNAQAHLAYLQWTNGTLQAAEATARRAVMHFTGSGITTAIQARCAYLALAGVALDQGETDTAARWIGLAKGTLPEPHTALVTAMIEAQIHLARGEQVTALRFVREARDKADDSLVPSHVKGRVERLEQRLTSPRRDRDGTSSASRTGVMPSPVTRQPGTVRERLAAHLRRVVDAVEEGSEDVAIDAIEDALSVAAPELLRRPFLTRRSVLLPVVSQRIARGTAHSRFAADLLDRMSTDPTSRQASMLLSPLTQRQRNILGYLATSLSAQEIADTLFLSINTLKTHQRAIYQKLDASNRRTAVENARTLGLL